MFQFKESPIHGEGVFATQNIPANKRLFQTHALDDDVWINIKPNCMYNHSKNANCESITEGGYKLLVCTVEIQTGEELLIDFTKDKDLEQPQEGWLH